MALAPYGMLEDLSVKSLPGYRVETGGGVASQALYRNQPGFAIFRSFLQF